MGGKRCEVLFPERPITLAHIREFCGKFNEGLRVEYKRDFDARVREHLPKVVSSFANSHGGVLVVGVTTVNGVPQGPFGGFQPAPREEFALTVENICLQNIYPPLLPRTTVVQSDAPDRVLLVIEVEESGEAPHAIENSKRVYVRTGNAANPYDLADVDLIIDLVKRRKEPLELRDRLLNAAQHRAQLVVTNGTFYCQVTVCPRFPRAALCSAQEVYDFVANTRYLDGNFISRDHLRRVPDGVAGQIPERVYRGAAYEEISRFGLLFARTQFRTVPWRDLPDGPPVLIYGDLFHPLCKFLHCADRFYRGSGYHGTLLVNVSLHNVAGRLMNFYALGPFDDAADDFQCLAPSVSTERLVEVQDLLAHGMQTLKAFLGEIAWSFWQSHLEFPRPRLEAYADESLRRIGLIR